MANGESSATRTSAKQAASKRPDPRKTRFGWRDVLRVVQSTKARQIVFERYGSAGFRPDDFGGSRKARETLGDALSAAEDWLELERPFSSERASIRALRSPLERELWP